MIFAFSAFLRVGSRVAIEGFRLRRSRIAVILRALRVDDIVSSSWDGVQVVFRIYIYTHIYICICICIHIHNQNDEP